MRCFRTGRAGRLCKSRLYGVAHRANRRGKGIAHLLLDRIVQDAKEQSYSYVEGYPFADRKFEYQYHGPIPLYEKHGFRMVAQKEWFCIMQKKL